MKNERNLIQERMDEHYSVSVSCRVPAAFHLMASEEARSRGISFSAYLGGLLLSKYQKGEEKTTEINLLLQERNLLQKQLEQVEAEKLKLSESQKLVLNKLMLNQELLLHNLDSTPTLTKQQLKEQGFDFNYATHHFKMDGKDYVAVFNTCYRLEGEQVIIIKTE